MSEVNELYREEFIIKSNARTQSELFEEIGNYLFEHDVVTDGFTQAVYEREMEYPTGIDLSVVADDLPNVALPHTEAKYCKTKVIVLVKLRDEILFNQMIQPEEPLAVRYLFFIINVSKEKQSTILSKLMEFLTIPDSLCHLDTLDTEKEIYEYLSNQQRMNNNE